MHTVDIVNDQMVVLDEDGNGIDMRILRSYRGAKHQIGTWAAKFPIDVADAYAKVRAYFVARRDDGVPSTVVPITARPRRCCMRQVADALRAVGARMQQAIDAGQRSRSIDADDLVEVLLAVADELDPTVRSAADGADANNQPSTGH
jgi:hypothetical protein